MRLRERQSVAVATGEQPVLAPLAAAPDRAYGVDHVTRRETKAWRDLRLSGVAAAELRARRAKLGASGAMDGAVDAAAAEQGLIGGIDDGVDLKPGDVAFDDLDAAGHRRALDAAREPRIKHAMPRPADHSSWPHGLARGGRLWTAGAWSRPPAKMPRRLAAESALGQHAPLERGAVDVMLYHRL